MRLVNGRYTAACPCGYDTPEIPVPNTRRGLRRTVRFANWLAVRHAAKPGHAKLVRRAREQAEHDARHPGLICQHCPRTIALQERVTATAAKLRTRVLW